MAGANVYVDVICAFGNDQHFLYTVEVEHKELEEPLLLNLDTIQWGNRYEQSFEFSTPAGVVSATSTSLSSMV